MNGSVKMFPETAKAFISGVRIFCTEASDSFILAAAAETSDWLCELYNASRSAPPAAVEATIVVSGVRL